MIGGMIGAWIVLLAYSAAAAFADRAGWNVHPRRRKWYALWVLILVFWAVIAALK